MKILRPPALRPGDTIGICAPASPAKDRRLLAAGTRYLEGLGYRIVLGKHVAERDGYLAGTDRGRASDINGFFSRRDVKAIFALRGGYGSARILPHLDYNLIRRNPKIVVGYSDITAMQLALFRRCGLVSFAGPMAAAALATGFGGRAEEWFWRMLTSARPPGRVPGLGIGFRRTPPGAGRGSRAGGGDRTGRLLGGNLAVMASLSGTPYLPDFRSSIMFIEDVGEYPYRLDRTLHQLRLAGAFTGLRAFVAGAFAGCRPAPGSPSLGIGRILDDALAGYSFPVVTGLHHGHIRNSICMPVGARARLSIQAGPAGPARSGRSGRAAIEIIESCVS